MARWLLNRSLRVIADTGSINWRWSYFTVEDTVSIEQKGDFFAKISKCIVISSSCISGTEAREDWAFIGQKPKREEGNIKRLENPRTQEEQNCEKCTHTPNKDNFFSIHNMQGKKQKTSLIRYAPTGDARNTPPQQWTRKRPKRRYGRLC